MQYDSAITTTPILIVAAVEAEVRSLIGKHSASIPGKLFSGGWPIYEITPDITVVLSGIGRVNAAGATVFALTQNVSNNYQTVINAGIAGALPGSGLRLGDIVIASESVFYEEGIDLPDGPGDLNALGFGLIESGCEWVSGNRVYGAKKLVSVINNIILNDRHYNPVTDSIATVARCSGTDKAARSVVQMTGSAAEAMEGAAVVFAAQRLGVSAVEIRVISNTCGERGKQKWDMEGALLRLDEVLNLLPGVR